MRKLNLLPITTMLLASLVAACGDDDDNTATTPVSPSVTATTTAPTPAPAPAPTPTAAADPTPFAAVPISACPADVVGMPASVGGTGGRFPVIVVAAAGCAWTATSDADWVTISTAQSVGPGATAIIVEANPRSDDTRSANVRFNNVTLHFSQANGCFYTIDPKNVEVGPEGGRVIVNLTTLDGCSWTVTASEQWIDVKELSGSGSAELPFEFDENGGGERHATITVVNQRLPVTQLGQ